MRGKKKRGADNTHIIAKQGVLTVCFLIRLKIIIHSIILDNGRTGPSPKEVVCPEMSLMSVSIFKKGQDSVCNASSTPI